MSLQNVEKTEMQMYADVRDLVNTFLRNSGLIVRTPTNYAIGNNLFGLNTSDEDLKAIFLRNLPPQIAITISDINDSIWEIQQWGQTSFQGLTNNTVFMDLYDTRRYGWVSTAYEWDKETQTGKAIVSWIKDIHCTLTFFKSRAPLAQGAGTEFLSAHDVAHRVMTWFQSDFGREQMAKKGFQCLITSEVRNPNIVIDNLRFDRSPNFTIVFTMRERQEVDVTENFVKEINQEKAFSENKNSIKLIGV
jgi:hypothetical protein